jgi:hypothetical protein
VVLGQPLAHQAIVKSVEYENKKEKVREIIKKGVPKTCN